jgi:hypothetical protein
VLRSTLVAWLALTACRSSPGQSVAWQAPVEIANGGGTKGPWQQNESQFDYVDDGTVALAADGSAVVVWVDHRDKDVHLQRFAAGGTRRGPAVNVSRTPAVFSWLPRIVVAGADVFVVWQEIIFSGGSHGGDILFARSRDGGQTFEPPLNLSQSIGGDGKGRIDAKTWHNGSLDLARAPDGTLHVAWTEYDGPLWLTSSRDGGETFAAPAQIAGTRERPARAPSLAADDARVFVAWTHGEDEAADIHVAAVDVAAAARAAAPTVVARTPTYADAPKLVLAGATLHLAYAETSGGPFDPASVMYTRTQLPALAFDPPRAIGDGSFPSLDVAGDRVTLVWEAGATAERARGLGYAMSRDRGETFGAPAPVAGSRDPDGGLNGSHQGRLMKKLDMHGSAIAIVGSALAQGRSSRVWLIRGHLQTRR